MSKKAEEAALKAYPTHYGASKEWVKHHLSGGDCTAFIRGYEQAEKDTVDRAAEWWYDHIVGFMKEGLAKNVIEEFREAMAGKEKEN